MRTKLRLSVCALISGGMLGLTLLSETRATVFALPATDTGFVTPPGGSAKGDGPVAKYNYSVGREVHYTGGAPGTGFSLMDRKNYFIFDLTGITDPIISASVSVYTGPAIAPAWPGGTHGYESADPSEFFELHATGDHPGALTAAAALLGFGPTDFDAPGDPGVTTASILFTKLATGPVIGGKSYTTADDGVTAIIPIDPSFLNAHLGGKVILAGLLPSSTTPTSTTTQEIFGFTGPDIPGGDPLTPTLTVTTPEPSAAAIAISLCAMMRMSRGRRA